MSISQPTLTQNPASKFIEWSGDLNTFFYFDKEKKEKVLLNSDLYIISLDQLTTISGFSEKNNSGIWANEIKDLKNDILIVKCKSGILISGKYDEIKEKLSNLGAKYTKSVYAAIIIPQENSIPKLELVNFKFHGSSVAPWIEAKVGDDGSVIVLKKGTEQKKKGKTVYYEPIIIKTKVREDILEKAISLDKELQLYLKKYFSKTIEAGTVISENNSEIEQRKGDLIQSISKEIEEVDDLPF